MAVTVVELPRGQSPLRVGTPVRFAWGTQKIEGIIIEELSASEADASMESSFS